MRPLSSPDTRYSWPRLASQPSVLSKSGTSMRASHAPAVLDHGPARPIHLRLPGADARGVFGPLHLAERHAGRIAHAEQFSGSSAREWKEAWRERSRALEGPGSGYLS